MEPHRPPEHGPARSDRDTYSDSEDDGYPEPVVFPPHGAHTHTAIVLHGRGDSGHHFGTLFLKSEVGTGENLQDVLPGFKFVFPTAKRRAVASFKGLKFNQWFDIWSLKDPSARQEDQYDGICESTAYIHDLIRKEAAIVGLQNVLLGGLSQGMALGLHVLLNFVPEGQDHLMGFFGMSGWLPFAETIRETCRAHTTEKPRMENDVSNTMDEPSLTTRGKAQTGKEDVASTQAVLKLVREIASLPPLQQASAQAPPFVSTLVFLGHGSNDGQIAPRLGREAKDCLIDLGCNVQWVLYEGLGHWYRVPEEIDDIVNFIRAALKNNSEKA